jgi:hypothetical protein
MSMFFSDNKMFRVTDMHGIGPSTDYFSSNFSIDGPTLIDEYNVIRNVESGEISVNEYYFDAALSRLRKDLKYGEEINDLIDLSTLSLGNKNRIQLMRNWNRKNLEDQSAWILEKERSYPDSTLKEVRYHSFNKLNQIISSYWIVT